jgi:cytochrome c oxidase subunit 3
LRRVQPYDPEAAKTGIWVALAAITMTFAAFTSAMVVREGSANDWRHFSFPPVLYFNTLALLASSFTLQIARRRFAALVSGAVADARPALRALYATFALGCIFVAGQYTAWLRLRSEGMYLATTPSSSFFYVFTVLHALHVIGGLGGLLLVITRLKRMALRRSTMKAASQYWHFMDVLWVYLLFLLWLRI